MLPSYAHQLFLRQDSRRKRIASRIQSAISQGQRLDKGVRHLLEQYLDSDLSQVFVHGGREAHALAQECGAIAFACGNHLFFQDGAYNPHTERGLRLLAHEAVHVIQQGQRLEEKRRFPRDIQIGTTHDDAYDPYEQVAYQAAEHVLAGLSASHLCAPLLQPSQQSPTLLIQRHASWEHRLLGDIAPPLLNVITTTTNGLTRRNLLENLRDFLWIWHQDPELVTPELIRMKYPYIKTVRLKTSHLLVTYGELNTLPDFFANPASIDEQPKSIMLPILQAVRQEGYNHVQQLLKAEGTGSFQGAVAINSGWGFVDLLYQTQAVDTLTWNIGLNHTNHYKAVLGRNACHFAPFSWHRWFQFYKIACEHAREAYSADDSDTKARRTYLAWTNHGYADHFLQDSFAAGHLVNKTMVMQWFVEWASQRLDVPVVDWDQVKTMTFDQQPGVSAVGLYDWNDPGTVRDPQTSEEKTTKSERIDTCGVRAVGYYTQEEAYQNYLSFMNNSVIQASTAALHDHFNDKSLWVTSGSHSVPFQIWGDDTMLNGGDGVRLASETAQKSQQSIVELLNHGETSITADALFNQFPKGVQDAFGKIQPLKTWQLSQKQQAFTIFPEVHYYLLQAVPRLQYISQDLK